MSVLAYSELLKRIVGVKTEDLETPFIILNKNNTTKNRLKVIKELSKKGKSTIGNLLKSVGLPRGGGSYLTIRNYFLDLEKQDLIRREKKRNKTFWMFTEKNEPLRKFISK